MIGLAPSASAAGELSTSLGVECENTAKWIHETTGPPANQRGHLLDQPRTNRPVAVVASHTQAVADVDRRGDQIAATNCRFRLQPNQLLIVDEASLAGTLALAEIAQQAAAAGAKVLLVGDHRQLSAIDAGGAFGLLATDTGAVELTSLWRFRHPWEATATQQLRVGESRAIDSYAAHQRLHEGPAEVMSSHAYRAWRHATNAGQQALLIAADNATVATLNDQARADRVIAGQVEPAGVGLHDGTTAGVGDIVVTRTNNRAIRSSAGAWVRNGDLWTIIHRGDDGALTVRRNRDHADPRTRESVVTLDPGYVAACVELGYATTAHRAQGMTVDTAFALLRPGMAREVAYVAMTRGRESNHAFIANDLPDPDYDGAPAPARTGRQIMEQILATPAAELSATQTIRDLYDQAESLGTLRAVHETLVQAAMKHRYQRIIANALPASTAAAVFGSPAYGALVTALRRVEHDGLDIRTAFRSIVGGNSLAGEPDPTGSTLDREAVRDPAALLQWRLEQWHAQTPRAEGRGPLLAGLFTPVGAILHDINASELDAIVDVETRIAARASAIPSHTLDHPPAWLHAPGPQPVDAATRARWRAAAASVASHREAGDVPESAHRRGPVPPNGTTQHDARKRALAACDALLGVNRQFEIIPEPHRSSGSASR